MLNAEEHIPQFDTTPASQHEGSFSVVETPVSEHPYELLVGHNRTDGSFKSTEQLQSEYVQLTDELIRQMTEGVRVLDPQTGETVTAKPDYVIWLDKSARPVAWLTQELWPHVASSSDEAQTPDMPKFRFVNIDRQQWVNDFDPNGTGYMDIDHIKNSVIQSLRSIFISPQHKANGLGDEIDNAESELDGKTILIVDEVRSTGRTLDIAQKFFTRAFPTARITTTYWMRGMTTVGTRRAGSGEANADLPVWYKEDDMSGRGVGNRNDRESALSPSSTQRLGNMFLSAALKFIDPETGKRIMDPVSRQLRQELRWLVEDLAAGKVLYTPSDQRDIDDYERRAVGFNRVSSLDEYVTKKRELARY